MPCFCPWLFGLPSYRSKLFLELHTHIHKLGRDDRMEEKKERRCKNTGYKQCDKSCLIFKAVTILFYLAATCINLVLILLQITGGKFSHTK